MALWALLHGVNHPEVLSKCTAAAQAPEAILDPLTTLMVTNFWLQLQLKDWHAFIPQVKLIHILSMSKLLKITSSFTSQPWVVFPLSLNRGSTDISLLGEALQHRKLLSTAPAGFQWELCPSVPWMLLNTYSTMHIFLHKLHAEQHCPLAMGNVWLLSWCNANREVKERDKNDLTSNHRAGLSVLISSK